MAEGLLALRGFMIAALLGPELFGIWASFRLAMPYAAAADAGILRGLEVQVARAFGGGPMPLVKPAETWGRAALGYFFVVVGLLFAALAIGLLRTGFGRTASPICAQPAEDRLLLDLIRKQPL